MNEKYLEIIDLVKKLENKIGVNNNINYVELYLGYNKGSFSNQLYRFQTESDYNNKRLFLRINTALKDSEKVEQIRKIIINLINDKKINLFVFFNKNLLGIDRLTYYNFIRFLRCTYSLDDNIIDTIYNKLKEFGDYDNDKVEIYNAINKFKSMNKKHQKLVMLYIDFISNNKDKLGE